MTGLLLAVPGSLYMYMIIWEMNLKNSTILLMPIPLCFALKKTFLLLNQLQESLHYVDTHQMRLRQLLDVERYYNGWRREQ